MGQRIRNRNRIKKSGTRLVSFLLAILLALLPAASGVGSPLTVFAESGTVRTLFYGNLLKEGSSFSFYGKDVPRNGMWAYQLNGTPVFCLEPTKRMFNGAAGRVDWYDIGTDELPYGITVEKAEALYYALTNGGNFEGGLCDVSKSQGGYMMMQAAVWAIMSDEWDIDKFQREMEDKIIPNAKDPSAGPRIRSYVDMFTKNATDQIRENVCPSFASKYPESAPSFQMKDNGDGTYQYSFTTDGSWMQNELVYEIPAGWEYRKSGNEVTFVCKNGNPNSGLIKGMFPEGSAARQYWYRPTRLAIVTPEGSDGSLRQAQIMMAGSKEPWEVYLQFGADTIPERPEGSFTIPYERFEHEETFHRNYNVELTKTDSETGKTLEDSSFQILEEFDFSQLSGTNLEIDQFEEPDQEGNFHGMSVCTGRITTDVNGHLSHSDEKTYHYYKTYCGGHPDPIIEEIETGDDASEEEEAEAEAANEENERLAWEQWQQCVDWCAENSDFHSVTEGNARDEMEEDRNEAYNTFIHLVRTYTAQEVTARTGYILHDLHNDDIQVEIVAFSSSQAGGDGVVTGAYPGNREQKKLVAGVSQATESKQEMREATPSNADNSPVVSMSSRERIPRFAALATDSQASMEPEDEMEGELEIEEEEPEHGTGSLPEEELEKNATPSNAEPLTYKVNYSESVAESGDSSWEWDGVLLPSTVAPINQKEKDTGHTGYHFTVADHRTEGEVHINKRDLELYQADESGEKTDSYGKVQGDATLENAVYGLYALDDINHPDGKTGTVFRAGELVSIASTDKEGNASFVAITEVSDTSKDVPNLNLENRNGNQWIGRPLILGRYYVQEISRSEGYELSRTGINLTESNRTGTVFPIASAGSVSVSGLGHRLNEWDGSFNDFTVTYYKTGKGIDISVTGYPEDSRFYRVYEKERRKSENIITGSELVEKKDADGNPVYVVAKGGEYKLDAEGNRKLLFDGNGVPVYGTEPELETFKAADRLKTGIGSITRIPGDPDMEAGAEVEVDYIMGQVNDSLASSGYKSSLDGYPWKVMKLEGATNGERVGEILSECAAEGFYDAYRLDDLYEEEGEWYALLRYGYLALKNTAVYDRAGERLFIKRSIQIETDGVPQEVFYYSVYQGPEEYKKNGNSFTVPKQQAYGMKFGKPIIQQPVCLQLYETYAEGEYLLDVEGKKVPVLESQPVYGEVNSTEYEEELVLLDHVSFNQETGITTIHMDTSKTDWELENGPLKAIFRAAGPERAIEVDGQTIAYADYLKQYQNASVAVYAAREPFAEGSYGKEAVLTYPGQWAIHQDAGTREEPVIVLQRNIKQAVKVTKDIAQDSYELVNTYKIHRDPFTVLFGGYKGNPAKTLKGFSFKIYLRQDLINTGSLSTLDSGDYDYEKFFMDNPQYADDLAIAWDDSRYDMDQDLTTVHACQGGGKDDYFGTSIPLPYGTYVIVEQQPVTIPTKHYSVDRPKEITLPFVPQIDADGTVHDKVASKDYFYDAVMTPEMMMEKYQIRFNEEGHIIYAHNNDGDFQIFKYGLAPSLAKDCGNDKVADYYHYGSISEYAGKRDGVYYDVYRDQEGNILDYGVVKDQVDTMTGVSTAIDRKFAPALVPWSVLDERYGDIINDAGDIGNREPGLMEDGSFNFVSFAAEDFENHFYSSRLRIEKLDSETGENIIHDGALFKIYAAKRDISGDGADGVTGSGKILFEADGTPCYDENEQIVLTDETGAEVGTFRAFSTIRDGAVTVEGQEITEKRGVGYIETPMPLGAGVYVLVEVMAPPGYVKSPPIAFEIYSDQVSYYPDGGTGNAEEAVRYQYVKEIRPDGTALKEDVSQIKVIDRPTHVKVHKVEKGGQTVTYRVYGSEQVLKARGDVTLMYHANGVFAGYGVVTKQFDDWSETDISGSLEELTAQEGIRPGYDAGGKFTGTGKKYDIYVPRATLTMYQGIKLMRTGEHSFANIEVERNWNDSVLSITALDAGFDTDIRKTGTDSEGHDIWDVTREKRSPVKLLFYDLKTGRLETDEETGQLYGLDRYGRRTCLVDPESGLAYVEDDLGNTIAWPLDEQGKKIPARQILVRTGNDGKDTIYSDLVPVTDENGLVIYYESGEVLEGAAEWQTPTGSPYELVRVPIGSYIIEEKEIPETEGYIKAMSIGLVVEETDEIQEYFMEDDFTKLEIAKLDRTTGKEVVGAELTLYEADRVPDDSERGWHLEAAMDWEGELIPYTSWLSGYAYDDDGNLRTDSSGNRIETTKPHWIDHIPPGDYLLVETSVDEAGGYVRAADVEVIVKESGEVQQVIMIDDHTSVEFMKTDERTGKALENSMRARLALYHASLNEAGEVWYDAAGNPMYEKNSKVFEWITDDGKAVAATGHEVEGEMVYDYQVEKVPGLKNAVYYVTETGALHIDYLPVGKYVWVEEQAPEGMQTASPIYVPVLEKGALEGIQFHTMVNSPVAVEFYKTNVAGGKVIAGAAMALYRADENGESPKYPKTDHEGKPEYVLDNEGNVVIGMDGLPIQKEEYREEYLVERWISGTDGRYTQKEEAAGEIPEGYSVGDLKPHRIEPLSPGIFYYVEEITPFGYEKGKEIRVEITQDSRLERIEMVNYLVKGRLEIQKYDEKDESKPLAGAQFKLENLDTNEALVLITDRDGRVASGFMPIGQVAQDGTVSLYRFRLSEVVPPDHYELDVEEHYFSFPCQTDRVGWITYHYGTANREITAVFSKVDITDNSELPGAHLALTDMSGRVIEEWVSGTTPHEVVGKLERGKRYRLTETKSPDGFAIAESVEFTVGKDGRVEPVVMKDAPTDVIVSKKGITGAEEVKGAHLQIRDLSGRVVADWVSQDTPYRMNGILKAGETYVLHEVSPAPGYAYEEDITFTVALDGTTDTVVMRDKTTHIRIIKQAANGGQELAGARLSIRDMDGNIVDSWITDGTPHDVTGLLVAGSSYVLHEERPPEGFAFSEDIPFTVGNSGEIQIIIMEDKPTKAVISKKSITGDAELPGARLQVRTLNGEVVAEWETGTSPHEITGRLLADTDYLLCEVEPPAGFAYSREIQFHVGRDGKTDPVLMIDEPTQVEIKKEGEGGTALEGAILQLIGEDGNVVEEWTSSEEPKLFEGRLKAGGIYRLSEKKPPAGYAYAKDVTFTVPDDGRISITMEDKKTHVEISKKKESGELLAGAHLRLLDSAGNVVKEWISEENALTFEGELEAGMEYTLVETQVPPGYLLAAPIRFTVGTDGAFQAVVMYNRLKESSGGGNGGGEHPDVPMMQIKKTDMEGKGIAGAEITVYQADGRILVSGVTNREGVLQFKIPADGTYTYRETKHPEGYLISRELGSFAVTGDGLVSDGLTIKDVKAPQIILTKRDGDTKMPLAGAEIGIYLGDMLVFTGMTGSEGTVTFMPGESGSYWYKELSAPDNYQSSQAVYRFEVDEEGRLTGDTELYNYKEEEKIGTIFAVYHGSGRFAGSRVNFGGQGVITSGAKTGDDTPFLLLCFLSVASSLWLIFAGRLTRRRLKRAAAMLLLASAMAFMALITSFAAENGEEVLQKEQVFHTDSPERVIPSFEDTLESDGSIYALIGVENSVQPAEKDQKKNITITSAPFGADMEAPEPEPTYRSPEDGLTYVLQESNIVDAYVEQREKLVTDVKVYEDLEQVDGLPDYSYVEVFDEITGKRSTKQVPLSSYAYEDYHWESGFEFPVTFSQYDAERYALGNIVIPHNDEKPELEGNEEALLALVGVSPDYYRIEDVVWISEPWTGEDGVIYRTAQASGEKLLASCRAVYSGSVTLPGEMGKALESVYVTETEQEEKPAYIVTCLATYQKISEVTATGATPGGLRGILSWISRHPVMALTGIMILILFVVTVLYLLSKKRREGQEVQGIDRHQFK